jgi:hypothetical protein
MFHITANFFFFLRKCQFLGRVLDSCYQISTNSQHMVAVSTRFTTTPTGGREELKKTTLLVFIQYFEENSTARHRILKKTPLLVTVKC